MGTRIYMAPELLLENPNYDFAIDIWSLGCIIGELLLNFIEAEEQKPENGEKQSFAQSFMFPLES